MKKRLLTLALLGAVIFGCAAPGLAAEKVENTSETETVATPAGPDDAQDRKSAEKDQVGFVSFSNIESRMRKSNLKIKMMDQTIDTLRKMDYDAIETQLKAGLSMIEQQVVVLQQSAAMEPIGAQVAITNLQAQAAELNEQLTAIKNGQLRSDNSGIIRQLENSQDLLVMGGETMFLALKAMETQLGALQRQLASLNRTVEEMELRYQMGHISALQLAEIKAGRSALISGMKTLEMNVETYKCQLEQFLGADLTGEITLGAVPQATQEQLDAMDAEKDWKVCKRRSYDIDAAMDALEEAEDAEKAAEKASGKDSYEYLAAHNAVQAAGYTYDDTVETAQMKFRALYAQVQDYRQILENAKTALECEEQSFAASELRYAQGTISEHTLLTAQDELTAAQEAVTNAENDLFSAYNTYCWAVETGILN